MHYKRFVALWSKNFKVDIEFSNKICVFIVGLEFLKFERNGLKSLFCALCFGLSTLLFFRFGKLSHLLGFKTFLVSNNTSNKIYV